MGPVRRVIPLVCALALLLVPARAAVLIHEYALRGSLDDSQGGGPLRSLGGDITALGYVFAANQGLALSSRLLTPSNFSLEFSFQLDSTSGYAKLVDFHHLLDDTGLYQHNGRLDFFPAAASPTVDITANTDVHVVLTRDSATNLFTGYVNGQSQFSFTDPGLLSTLPGLGNTLYFFVDDFATGRSEASGGTLNYLRVFNGALSAVEVNALYTAGPPLAIPEPSTLALLLLGAGTAVLTRATARRWKQ